MGITKWWYAVLLAALLAVNVKALELDPVCDEYYEMIQQPGLTYDDIGRIAEAMYHGQCWPAMQGLLDQPQPQAQTGELPSCELLAQSLEASDQVRKLLQARPLVKDTDCGAVAPENDYWTALLSYNGVRLSVAECNLLVDDPSQLAVQRPDLGFRPVNCRGRVVYSDGSRAPLYFFMEQFPDGDSSVMGFNIPRWGQ